MKYGYYSDNDLTTLDEYPFRCPSWTPMPDGKKNVVILGCSHTWGVGLEPHQTWAHKVSQHSTDKLRYWNLGQPGASAEACVRILYSSQKVINPKIIIVCWPDISRRERLEKWAILNKTGVEPELRYENDDTDINNFLKSVFFLEKYAEVNRCTTFHCFAQDSHHDHIKGLNVLEEYTIKNCWPHWDKFTARDLHTKPSLAGDGLHYGEEHHERFAQLFLEQFSKKLR